MHYIDFLQQIFFTCPFCDILPSFVIDDSKYFIVTPARAPYAKDHILIVPRQHKILFSEFNASEINDLFTIIYKRNERLHATYQNVTLLLRDGPANIDEFAKSIDHFHVHLIPNIGI